MTGPARERLIAAIRATPPYPSDGAEDVADALVPVVTSWGWLMELLAEHYPPDVFPGGPDADPGPQIVALTREVDRLRRETDGPIVDIPAELADANERLGAALVEIGHAAGLPAGSSADQILAEVQRRYPRRCSQCGQRWADRACGPTHAVITEELGIGDLRRELAGCRAAGEQP